MVKLLISTQETPEIVTYADKFVHKFLRGRSDSEGWNQLVGEIRKYLHRLARDFFGVDSTEHVRYWAIRWLWIILCECQSKSLLNAR